MVIGCCQIEVHLPACGSLKEKRRVLASLRDRLRRRHNVSFAEVAHQDLWQRAGLAVVAVAAHHAQLDSVFTAVEEDVRRAVPGELLAFEVDYV
jgi:hypothetical protein